MRNLAAVLTAAVAASLALPFYSARASSSPTLTGSINLFFHDGGPPDHNSVFDGASGAPGLAVPVVIDETINPAVLGPGTINWGAASNWVATPLDISGFSINVFGPGTYSAIINGGAGTLDVLHGLGPSASTAQIGVQFTTINGNPSAGFSVFSNLVGTQFNVDLPANAHLLNNQFQVTLHNFTLEHGSSISDGSGMLVHGDLTNHGSGNFAVTVEGNFINDAFSANGDVANATGLTLNGQFINTGEFYVPTFLLTQVATSNSGLFVVNGGQFRLNANFTNNATMQLSSGSIGFVSTGTVINNNSFQWTGGTIVTTLTNNAAFTITGANEELTATTLTNAATIIQSGASTLTIDNGGTLANLVGATYDITDDSGIVQGFGVGTFTNAGIFRKSGGSGTSTISAVFNNTGTVRVESGTLAFTNGGNFTATNFVILPGKTAQLSGGTFFLQGISAVTNGGNLAITAGIVTVATGQSATLDGFSTSNLTLSGSGALRAEAGGSLTLNFPGSTAFLMTAGQLGGNGTVTNIANLRFTGGTIAGNVTNSASSFTIPSGSPSIFGGLLTNTGIITQSGASVLNIGGTGSLHNQPGGLYDIQDDSGLAIGFGGGSIVNTGTFRKSGGTGTSQIDVSFTNSATIQVDTGTLYLAGGGSLNSGAFQVTPTASIRLNSFDVQGTVVAFGGGNITIFAGLTTVSSGNSATFTFSDGTSLFDSANGFGPAAGANLTLNLTGSSSFYLATGNLGGNGTTFNTGTFRWGSGTLVGVLINSSSTFFIGDTTGATSNSTATTTAGATLTNSGTITQSSIDLFLNTNATLNNQASGTYVITDDHNIFGSGTVTNAGILKKTGGTVNSQINASLDNTGTLEVDSATLFTTAAVAQVSGNTLTAGTWSIGGNATLNLLGRGALTINQGTVLLRGPNADFVNFDTVTTNQGSFSITGGASFSAPAGFTNSGNFTLGPASTFVGTGTFTNNGGLAIFQSDVGPVTATLSVVVNSGAVMFASNQHLLALTVNGGVAAVPSGVTKTGFLSIAGSTNAWTAAVDIEQGKIIVEDTSPTRASDLANYKNQASHTAGNTVGIYSFALLPGQVVVVSDNSIRLAAFGASASNFGGTNNADASSILITATYLGDANLDGVVDIKDLQDLANHWQQPATDWSQADYDGNGIVALQDLQAIANHWQNGVGSGGGGGEQSFNDALALVPQFGPASLVPEPATLLLLSGIAAPLLLSRRKYLRIR